MALARLKGFDVVEFSPRTAEVGFYIGMLHFEALW